MSAAAILILNYNGGDVLGECLRSLGQSDAAGLPVLLVDNASTDGSAARAAQEFAAVEVLALTENHGFAAGVNAGLRRLAERRAAPVLLLNPDTRVHPCFFAPLSEALAAGADVAGPKILDACEPRLWSAGGRATFGLNLCRLRGHREADRGQWDRAESVSFLPGTAWLLSQRALEVAGDLDESFFLYLEDLDWCLRAAAGGLRLVYEPRSVVVHLGSHLSGGGYTPLRKYLNAHGSRRLLQKHGTPARWLTFLFCDVLSTPLALLYGLLRGRPAAAAWKLRGLWDGFRGRPVTEELRQRLLEGTGHRAEDRP